MSERLERFLSAHGLDDAADRAAQCADLSVAEVARVRAILAGENDDLARRNLLLHPELIPHDIVSSVILAGLRAADSATVLAAVVGAHRAAGTMTVTERPGVTAAVLGLLPDAPTLLARQRASAALVVLAAPGDSAVLIGHLADPDPVVRHNVRAALIRTLGAGGAVEAVVAAVQSGVASSDAARFVDAAVDGGQASVRDLVVRGVITAQLAPISTLEG